MSALIKLRRGLSTLGFLAGRRDADGTGNARHPGGVSIALLLVAAGGFLLRAMPLLRPNGALPSDKFDDGVYFSAAALFTQGQLPYEDFVFVHPPGIVLIVAPMALLGTFGLGYGTAFVVARWVTVAVAVANVLLIGRLALRWRGAPAALLAASLYATFPPAVRDENSTMIEPFLNLATLIAAGIWLGKEGERRSRRELAVAGLAFGVLPGFKLYGGIVLLAALVAGRFVRPLRDRTLLVASAGCGFALVSAFFALRAGPPEFVRQVVLAQLSRPAGDVKGGEIAGVIDRSAHMFQWGPLAFQRFADMVPAAGLVALAVGLGVAAWAWGTGEPQGRFWALAGMLTVGAFLISAAYYDQYPIFLAVPMSLLLGSALAELMHHRRWRTVSSVALAGLLVLPVANNVRDEFRTTYRAEVASTINEHVAEGTCVYSDPANLAIAADRPPPETGTGRILVDPFGELLYVAQRSREPFRTVQEALESPSAQARLRGTIAACEFVVLGTAPEQHARWSDATRRWFMAHFRAIVPPDRARPGLWQQRTSR